MVFTNTPSDRVQVVGRGDLLHPGACALCGSGNCDEGYVDTGIYYDYEGQVYFCMTCATQIAEAIGCLTALETLVLREQVETSLAKLRKAESELEAANGRLRAFDVAFAGVKFPDEPSNPAAGAVDEDTSDSVKVDEEVTTGPGNGKPKVKKSTVVKGRNGPEQSELLDTPPGNNKFEL